ncbi:acyl-CoA thioesterase [Agrobacterium tumefaciens]|uniref:4-hydroxybenzoyl-CoA thioesterase n=1 Tax=Agrobacterium tumefaciens TaxID=358 RepID=A0A2L2LM49_AGRTU|nr:acyl-CoA thioesterase [Agrobacterium tumefaciens]AVH45405.1 4-hydroxybenzoyl-CoA thioesterase [Agrobacterium tumefaciens]NSY99134.1 acyl-CoA thioesterase [Agrobacterium tumefaciens]
MPQPIVFTSTRLVEWGQCDPAGIVYYPRFFEMCDANTNALFAHATGMDKKELQSTYGIVGWPMIDSRASFQAPASYGDTITVSSHAERFGRSSMEIHHRIAHADGRVIAVGMDKRVWVGRDPEAVGGIKSVPLPDAFTSRFMISEGE